MSAMPVAEFEPLVRDDQSSNLPPVAPPRPPEPVKDEPVAKEQETPTHEKTPTSAPKDEDVLEVLIPSAEPRVQKILTEDGAIAAEYTQKPLSYLRKMQFFKLVAKTVKEAIAESGTDVITEIFGGGVTNLTGAFTQNDFDDASGFMKLVLSVVELSEDFIEDAYVIWLAVPPGQREWAKAAMRGDLEGIEPLSDEDGTTILKTFVVQNWGAMQAFFRVHLREVFEVARTEQRRLNSEEG